jgi:hypothetical protein
MRRRSMPELLRPAQELYEVIIQSIPNLIHTISDVRVRRAMLQIDTQQEGRALFKGL